MPLNGLQMTAGRRICIPRARAVKPDADRLEVRYGEFKTAG
ncbi:MAG: hypothetical protein M0019_06980 [Actinomycetota bacterium]|nr:hypothetical protein [Actinomycetota bacterium]